MKDRRKKREESDMDGWGEGEEVREKEKERKDKLRILKQKCLYLKGSLLSGRWSGHIILSHLSRTNTLSPGHCV